MLYKKYISFIFFVLLLLGGLTSCKKYLDKKPIQTLQIPSTLKDLQVLIDNDNIMNLSSSPQLLEIVADDYYVPDWELQSTITSVRQEIANYLWQKDAVHTLSWDNPYQGAIYYSNFVLDALGTIPSDETNMEQWNNVKGTALFFRAYTFYELAQLYCKPYTSTASKDPGIVLRLTSDINETSVRSTVQQTYDQIINDLKMAVELLGDAVSLPTRPSKAAALGALARVYLSMRDYANAGLYADLTLRKNSSLIDYNTLSGFISRFNTETIFFSYPPLASLMANFKPIADTLLYKSYNTNDLRKDLFFMDFFGDGSYFFLGSYAEIPPYRVFSGIATDEIYLIRAEAAARTGLKDSAMNDLNRLMIKRWRNNGSWVPFSATDVTDALQKILAERRKELVWRGQRWTDLRRLNVEGANITLKRIVGGITYTLPPNDPRWVMLIPQDVINRSGIAQNIRD